MAAAADTQNRDEIWGQTGDKRGTQPPATPRTALQRKSQFVINARENTCFSDIVGILENTLVAEEGLVYKKPLAIGDFGNGKCVLYTLSKIPFQKGGFPMMMKANRIPEFHCKNGMCIRNRSILRVLKSN
jgi:hypothetical protein